MKDPALYVYVVRGFEGGLAERASIVIGQGLIEYDDDGRMMSEPHTCYQFGDSFDSLLTSVERTLVSLKSHIMRTFDSINGPGYHDDEDVQPKNLVIHCHNPQPQAVKEIEKLLHRYFRDSDVYELADITIKINPERFHYANSSSKCKEFQDNLFA